MRWPIEPASDDPGGLPGYLRNGTSTTTANPTAARTSAAARGRAGPTRPRMAAYTSARIPPIATA